MRKYLGFLALAVLMAAIAACGGGQDVDNYAEDCGEWESEFGSYSDVEDVEDALEEWEEIEVAGDVKNLHNLRTSGLKISLEYMEKKEELDEKLDELRERRDDARRSERDDIDDEIDDLQDEFEDEVDELEDQFDDLRDDAEEEWDDLSPRNQRDLSGEGCNLRSL